MKKYQIPNFNRSKLIGGILIFLAVLSILLAAFYSSQKSTETTVFSNNNMLRNLWSEYKQQYLEANTYRTLDKQQDGITTSEGQSYTMLRAVWMDDKETFDKSWQWTKDNLQRKNDHLFSWLFGKRSDGSYGVIVEKNGENTATDGDLDIALSLIFAYSRWQDPNYMGDAIVLIRDIWKYEVINIAGKPVLVANNIERDSKTGFAIVNPSYFAPYTLKIFAKLDTENDWMSLVSNMYDVVEISSTSTLDKKTSIGLPPDWVVMNTKDGSLSSSPYSNLTTNYSYDAMRTPWRLALDWQWYKDPRDKKILDKYGFLQNQYSMNKEIYTNYTHDGNVVATQLAPAIYGGSIGYFIVSGKPEVAKELYKSKLESLYSPDSISWKQYLGYYDSNWAWFGVGLYTESLKNLSLDIK